MSMICLIHSTGSTMSVMREEGMIFLMTCIIPSSSDTSCSMSTDSTRSVMREDEYDILDSFYWQYKDCNERRQV